MLLLLFFPFFLRQRTHNGGGRGLGGANDFSFFFLALVFGALIGVSHFVCWLRGKWLRGGRGGGGVGMCVRCIETRKAVVMASRER